MSWWKINLGTWFWPKCQSLTFQYIVKFWSVDWKIHLSSYAIEIFWTCWMGQDNFIESLCPWLSLICYWLGQTVKNCLCTVKTLRMTILPFWWSDQISCGIVVPTWSNDSWVHNVDVGQNAWGLIVNCPQLTFSPIQLISRSTVQLTGQKLESRLETWYEQTYESTMKYESQFEHWRSKNPYANSNPYLGHQCKEMPWAVQTLA